MTTETLPTPDDLAELEYRASRHVENVDGIRRTEEVLAARAAEYDATVADLTEAVAQLPPDAGAQAVFDAKSAVLAAELARGLDLEELERLRPQRAEQQDGLDAVVAEWWRLQDAQEKIAGATEDR